MLRPLILIILNNLLFIAFLSALLFVAKVHSHGMMIDPPSRSSMFRYKETNPLIIPYASIVEDNWTDNELFCGGFSVNFRFN